MSQVIRISDDLFKRLETHATGFVTPSNVIEKLLNFYEGKESKEKAQSASSLEIIYPDGSEELFKTELLEKKKAFVKLIYTNETSDIKEWNASKSFSKDSNVAGNLRSGILRNWKKKGIYKAELSFKNGELK